MGQYLRIALVLIAVAAVALIAIFLLVRPSGGLQVSVESENLSSSAGPRFASGEEYGYKLRFGGAAVNASVGIGGIDGEAGCLRAVRNISGLANASPLEACYSTANGSAAYFSVLSNGEWKRMPPETYAAEPVMIFYEPWMLSLREGWSGALNVTMKLSPGAIEVVRMEQRSANSYRFLRRENYSGRAALVAEAVSRELEISDGGENVTGETRRTVWVDEEKRVVLKDTYDSNGETVEEVLVRAPFRLSLP